MSTNSYTLHTDLYQLTMSAIYHARNMGGMATFSLFTHNLPDTRNFIVTAGLEQALDYLENFTLTKEDLDYLASLNMFEESFLTRLAYLNFSGEVRAVPEGTICAAGEPLVEITAPLIEAQMVETLLMNTININSTLASKAARSRLAAKGKGLLEFGLRRTQGLDAGMSAARSAAMVGFIGTSNVAAAKKFDIIPVGTMAHSYITAFNSEMDAFRAFAATFPQNTILLVDTYDVITGVKRAIEIGMELRKQGHELAGVRIDSGDLGALSFEARKLLDAAGLTSTKVVVSGNLEEMSITKLMEQKVPIDTFAVGTRMSSSADAPVLDLAYKLVNYNQRPTLKLSTGKETLPNPKQIWRQYDADGKIAHDLIGMRDESQPGKPLLVKVMENGRRTKARGTWRDAKQVFESDLATLPEACLSLTEKHRLQVELSPALSSLQSKVRAEALAAA